MIAFLSVAWAGGFEVAQQSAVAGGTGHASTARADDAGAAWFVPAALADGRGLRVAVGGAVASSTIEAEADGWSSTTVNAIGTPPHLYASASVGRFVGGVAANTAFAGGVRWPSDGPLRFESVASSPRFFRVAPFLGVRVDRLRVAVGFHVDAGSLGIEKATDHVTEEGTATISLRGSGIGADASAWLAATDALSVGLSYKGRTRLDLAGEADFDVPPAFADGLADGATTAEWRLPDRLALGLMWNGGYWRVLVDGVWTVWSVNDMLVVDFADPASSDVTQTNRWRDGVAVRGGGEVDVDRFTFRAGAYGETAPSPVSTLVASSPDGPRVGATVGVGAGFGEHLRFDAFGEVLRVLERTSTTVEALPATYRGRAIVGGLTVAVSL